MLFRPRNVPFIGLANFASAILADEVFWISLRNSLFWIGLVVSLQFLLGLCAPRCCSTKASGGAGIARVADHHPVGAAQRHHRPDVELDVRFPSRRRERPVRPPRPHRRAGGLAGAARHRALRDHRRADLAGLSVLHRRHPRGPADDTGRAVRSGGDRRRLALAAAAISDPPVDRRHRRDRAAAAHDLGRQFARRDPGHDRRRPRLCHAHPAALRFREGLQRHGVRLRGGAGGDPDAPSARRGPQPTCAAPRGICNDRPPLAHAPAARGRRSGPLRRRVRARALCLDDDRRR